MIIFVRALLLLMLLSLPANAQEGVIPLEVDQGQDRAIAKRIENILGQLESYAAVDVEVVSGVVTLRGEILDADGFDDLDLLVSRIEGIVAIKNEVTSSAGIMKRLEPAMGRFWSRTKQGFAFLPVLIVALLTFAAIVGAGFAVARLHNIWDRLAPNSFVADIYRTLIRLAFIVGGLIIALEILGASALLRSILGAAGIIGLAIGFAVRDTVGNFIASLLLSIRQPFRPNDTIEIGGDIGRVIRLTSRATILLSFDGNHIRIPNATVFKSRIINYTRNRERRFEFTLDMPRGVSAPKDQARAFETLNSLPFILSQPVPEVWISDVTDDKITLKFLAWIDQHHTDFARARGQAMRLVKLALENKLGTAKKRAAEMTEADQISQADDDSVLEQMVEEDRRAHEDSDLLTPEGAEE